MNVGANVSVEEYLRTNYDNPDPEFRDGDDRLTKTRSKLNEYRDWGVKYAWLVDPLQRRMYTCDGALSEVASLRIPELDIEILPVNIFKQS
jgi:Uma2 family endonuclease